MCQAVEEIERRARSQHALASTSNGNGSGNRSSIGEHALQWYNVGEGRLLARYPSLLCEYDVELRSPVGAVFINMGALPQCQASHC